MTPIYPVLYAPQTGAPLYATTSIAVCGVRMSAAAAMARYPLPNPTLINAGYLYPTAAQMHALADSYIEGRAIELQTESANGYGWPEAANWTTLEAQARAYLSDPQAPPGRDLAAEVGPGEDLATRAGVIVAKADAFRGARGAIVRWRREARTDLDAALTDGLTADQIISRAAGWLNAVAAGLPA